MRRPALWVPALLLGAVLYWTVAIGLGGLSLALLGGGDGAGGEGGAPAVAAPAGDEPIYVNLQADEEAAPVTPPPPRVDPVGRTAF